ncbi:MAG: aminopeptidase [Haloferula sp.]
MKAWRECLWLLLAGSLMLFTSCGTATFYSQAAVGQLEVLSKRQPVDRVIAETEDEALRERLELNKRLLAFAESELHMPSGGAYELYAEIGRKHLVWVVHAAPELSMEPKRWWYPVVGKQAYRGFFREELAKKEIARLEKDGMETWVGGVDAFSTLGWFRDPVMDTFVRREEVDYAELIFHELVHRTYYVSGETDFNEAMAEAVAREGVRRWFRASGRPELVERYDERLRRINQAREAIGGASERLEAIYARPISDAEKRRLKAAEIAQLKSRLRELRTEWGRGLKSWIDGPINNARLNSFTTYEAGVPRFVALIEECGGDFEVFWERVKELEE